MFLLMMQTLRKMNSVGVPLGHNATSHLHTAIAYTETLRFHEQCFVVVLMTSNEELLVRYFHGHAQQKANYSHHWQPSDTLIWDSCLLFVTI